MGHSLLSEIHHAIFPAKNLMGNHPQVKLFSIYLLVLLSNLMCAVSRGLGNEQPIKTSKRQGREEEGSSCCS